MQITSDLRIGITATHDENIWSNGLYQNIYHLFNILKDAGYQPDLVSEVASVAEKSFMGNELKLLTVDNCHEYDLLIEVCSTLSNKLADKYIKELDKAAVTIQYGNEFLITIVCNSIYNHEKLAKTYMPRRKGIWISPHFQHAQQPLSILNRTKVDICPYIWSPLFLLKDQKEEDLLFNKNWNMKHTSVLESNLYYVKTSHVPMLIIEEFYRNNPSLVDNAFIFGSKFLTKSHTFARFAKDLKIVEDNKMSFEARYRLPYILKKDYAGIMVSHQVDNALNYLQLEAMYLGVPFVHNSEYFKDHGYYYERYNAVDGAKQLELAYHTHKNNYEYLRERDLKRLYDFHPKNTKNIEGYARLIEDLVKKHIVKK